MKPAFFGRSTSIEGVSLAMYLTELAAALSPTGEEAARELRLVLNSLYTVSYTHLLSNCFLISDKSRCIAGSVLELVCAQVWQ